MVREDGLIVVRKIRNTECTLWNRKPRVRVSCKRWNEEKLYKEIKELLLLSYRKKMSSVCADNIALELKARLGQVRKIFMRLNREGILSQKRRVFAHDTNRNWMFPGRASGWASNYYDILDEIERI